jgi:hypothetical protein
MQTNLIHENEWRYSEIHMGVLRFIVPKGVIDGSGTRDHVHLSIGIRLLV